MNETILELILTAVMFFFMVLGLYGCRRERKLGIIEVETPKNKESEAIISDKQNTNGDITENRKELEQQ